MKPSLHMNIKQSLSLSPKLQQAIRLLQLSAQELDAEVKVALETNPLLEVIESWDDGFSHSSQSESDFDYGNILQTTPSLQDYLLWQLNLTPFSDSDHIIAITLIDSINDDGYLSTSIEDIFLSLKNNYPQAFSELDLTEVLAVLHRIQQFDPPGIAARDLVECMLLQLPTLEIDHDLRMQCQSLIAQHLSLLAKKDYSTLRTILQIDAQRLEQIILQIKKLNPKPGLIITHDTAEYQVPDVIVEKINDNWQVSLNANLTHQFRINANYAQLMRNATNEYDSAVLRKHYTEAQWLLESIRNRNITLLKVANYIAQYQSEFLEHGETMMRPLILQVIAQDLQLSESTISRITTKKYIYTPRGMFELKFFFSSQISVNDGENCSSTAVKAMIKQLISQEASDKPLSDQDIADLIIQRGINIARRTVAKYREALGIQSSTQRGT